MKRLGIFGGSFNPIHNGHIKLGEAFFSQAKLDELWFVVSPQNPLKQNADLLDDNLRLEMTRLALELGTSQTQRESLLSLCFGANEEKTRSGLKQSLPFKASDFEFHLPRPSYMINTLNAIRTKYPDYQPILLIGEDNWERFPQWYHSEEIKAKYEIFIYPRKNPSTSSGQANTDSLPQPLPKGKGSLKSLPLGGDLEEAPSTLVDVPLLDISSTQIRNLIRQGRPIAHLVPPAVADYIQDRKLYR